MAYSNSGGKYGQKFEDSYTAQQMGAEAQYEREQKAAEADLERNITMAEEQGRISTQSAKDLLRAAQDNDIEKIKRIGSEIGFTDAAMAGLIGGLSNGGAFNLATQMITMLPFLKSDNRVKEHAKKTADSMMRRVWK
jgi:hypothetical protein